jgi:hypothetical protein
VAGVGPQFEDYEGDDPLEEVLSLNEHRRNETAGQRAIAAAKVWALNGGTKGRGQWQRMAKYRLHFAHSMRSPSILVQQIDAHADDRARDRRAGPR